MCPGCWSSTLPLVRSGQKGILGDFDLKNTPSSSIGVFRHGAASEIVLLALSQVSCVGYDVKL